MLNMVKNYWFILFFLFIAGAASGQTREELEKRKRQLEEDIRYTQSLLRETQQNVSSSEKELRALNSQIAARQKLIDNINSQVRVLDNEMAANRRQINRLKEKLEELKKEYAGMVKFAFRNKDAYSKLMFIFAASDFQQAFRRVRYLRDISEYRRKQARYIQQTQEALNKEQETLRRNRIRQVELLAEHEDQYKALDREKEQQAVVVEKLQDKEASMRAQLAQKQDEARRLDAAITAAIRKEMEEARKRAEAEARARGEAPPPETAPTASSSLALTPEARALSASFAGNRGRLPWPVERGVIVDRFGTHAHPVLKGVTINNNGVDIETDNGATARAVFDGEVTGIAQIAGDLAVLVRHGEYITVYANLMSVSVQRGDKVGVKDPLGTVRTTPDDGTILKFQVWKGLSKMNPEYWLYGN